MKLFTAALVALSAGSASAFAPSRGHISQRTALSMTASANNTGEDRRSFVTKSGTAAAGLALSTLATATAIPMPANAAATKQWASVKVPFEDTVYDIDFDSPTHGYIVGARGSFAETNDGGETWEPRSFSNLDAEEEITYRFQTVSFQNGEGWVLGKPTLLLHTKDSGKSWERIPLSPKLPGEPTGILALGPNQAEMITSSGAVYVTENAVVVGTVDPIRSSGT